MPSDFGVGKTELGCQFTDLKGVTRRQHDGVAACFKFRIIGLKKGICGVFSRSIQIFIGKCCVAARCQSYANRVRIAGCLVLAHKFKQNTLLEYGPRLFSPPCVLPRRKLPPRQSGRER